jgi:hypothetical protein
LSTRPKINDLVITNLIDTTLQKMLAKHGFGKVKSYLEFPSIYGGNRLRDLAQIFVWCTAVLLNKISFGNINLNRSLVYIFKKL